jgi:hypothetical protein
MPATAFGRKNKNYIVMTLHKLMMTNAIYIYIIWPLLCITFGGVILQPAQQQHYRLTDQGFEYR